MITKFLHSQYGRLTKKSQHQYAGSYSSINANFIRPCREHRKPMLTYNEYRVNCRDFWRRSKFLLLLSDCRERYQNQMQGEMLKPKNYSISCGTSQQLLQGVKTWLESDRVPWQAFIACHGTGPISFAFSYNILILLWQAIKACHRTLSDFNHVFQPCVNFWEVPQRIGS